MGEADLQRFRQAWRDALDDDVLRGLRHPDDYAPEVLVVIGEEAARRNLRADAGEPEVERPSRLYRFAADHLLPALRAIGRLPPAHPLMAACLLGVGLRCCVAALALVLGESLHSPTVYWLTLVLFSFVYLATLVWICWPLSSFLAAVVVPVVVIVCRWLPELPWLWEGAAYWPASQMIRFWGLQALYSAVAPVLLLSLAVMVRRRLWPIYPLEQCAKCGYDLRGLPEPRCPECGEPFGPANEGPHDSLPTSARP